MPVYTVIPTTRPLSSSLLPSRLTAFFIILLILTSPLFVRALVDGVGASLQYMLCRLFFLVMSHDRCSDADLSHVFLVDDWHPWLVYVPPMSKITVIFPQKLILLRGWSYWASNFASVYAFLFCYPTVGWNPPKHTICLVWLRLPRG